MNEVEIEDKFKFFLKGIKAFKYKKKEIKNTM